MKQYCSESGVHTKISSGSRGTRASIFIVAISVMGAVLSACSSNPTLTVDPEGWTYEAKAISLEIRATADLNSVAERPHALALAIYQLSDTNTFTGLTTTKEGTVELLNKGKIDLTVVQYTRIIVQPGEKKTLSLDRAQTAKFIGVVAGYQELNPALDVRVFPIPMVPNKRGIVDKLLVSTSLIADEAKATPGKLFLSVELEGQGTRRMKDVTKERLED
jgi:type VI secretion system VasD/TssJ family lipoprotein